MHTTMNSFAPFVYVHVLMKELCIKPFTPLAIYTCGAAWSDLIVVSCLLNTEDTGKCIYDYVT